MSKETIIRNGLIVSGDTTADNFIKIGGTNGQFLMADGSSNSNTYLTTTGATNYATLSGSTFSGPISATNLSGTNTGDNSPNSNTGITHTFGDETISGVKTFNNEVIFNSSVSGLTKSIVGLSNVDNTSDLNKPVSTLQQTAINLKSAGVTSEVNIVDNGNGLIDIQSSTANLYPTSGFTGVLSGYTIPALTGVQLVANTYTYISINYNGGSPIYQVIYDNNLINHSNILNSAQVYWESLNGVNVTHIFNTGLYGLGLSNKISHRLIHEKRFGYESGLVLGESGTRNINIGAGRVWYDGEEINTLAVNTSIGGQESRFYYHNGGTWNVSLVSQYNNTQYDNGANLVTLSNNEYGVIWVYKCVNKSNTINFYILGNGSYKLSDAQASKEPQKPDLITKQGILVGRIIVLKGSNSATQIDSAFTQAFANSGTFNHNDLNNIQGGTINDYQHLTTAQLTIVTGTSGINTGDQDLTPYATLSGSTFTGPISTTTVTGTSFYSTSLNTTEVTRGIDSKMGTGIPWDERKKFKVDVVYSGGNITATMSFNPTYSDFSYYINDKKFTVTASDIAAYTQTAAASEGTWFLFINNTTTNVASPVITLTKTPWAIYDPDVLLWNLYFNATNNTITWIGEERHTYGRDLYNHARNHAQGAIYRNGLLLSQYNGITNTLLGTNTDNNFGRASVQISDGGFFDEDILNNIAHSDSSISSTTETPETNWDRTVNQFLGFTALAAAGTTTTSIVFPTSRTLVTGQAVTVMAGNTTTVRGTTTISAGGTGTTFTVTTVAGMTTGDAIVIGARIPIYHINSVSGGVYVWRKLASSDFLGVSGNAAITTANIATANCQYNNATAGGFTTMTANRYFPIYLVATNSTSEPVVAILGQGQSTNSTLATALTEAPFQFSNVQGLSGLSFQEMVPFYRLTYIYNTTAGFNASRMRLSDATFINVRVATASGSIIGGNVTPTNASSVAMTPFDTITATDVQNGLEQINAKIPSLTPYATLSGSTFTGDITASNLSGTNTGDKNGFSNVAVSGQNTLTGATSGSTLNLVAGSNMTITTDSLTNTVTLTSTASGTTAAAEFCIFSLNNTTSGKTWSLATADATQDIYLINKSDGFDITGNLITFPAKDANYEVYGTINGNGASSTGRYYSIGIKTVGGTVLFRHADVTAAGSSSNPWNTSFNKCFMGITSGTQVNLVANSSVQSSNTITLAGMPYVNEITIYEIE